MSSTAAADGAAAPSSELVRLQGRVAAAPQSFEDWTALVSECERSKDVALVRQAIDGLLQQFPLCFGYWQRLAKLELAQAQAQPAVADAAPNAGAVSVADAQQAAFKVLEAGLQAIPHSYELWTFYVTELMKTDATPEHIRRSVKPFCSPSFCHVYAMPARASDGGCSHLVSASCVDPPRASIAFRDAQPSRAFPAGPCRASVSHGVTAG
jgi:hypothetical protein